MSKTDRTARLVRVIHMIHRSHHGLSAKEIAAECEVHLRTTYRDIQTLECEIGVPLWPDGAKYRIMDGFFLPPVQFSLPEAMTIFLAARLMLQHTHRHDPNIDTTFQKLNSIVPSPLKEQIRNTMEWMQKLPMDDHYLRILATLSGAWARQRTVRMQYHTFGREKPTERSIDPYFVEPVAADHSSYVMGYCHRTQEIRTFKVERIKSIEMTSASYDIPADFDANAYLAAAWGINAGDKAETVRLKFKPDVARILEEATYHPSQIVERQADGTLIMTLRVATNNELCSWILGWGEKVEVLEPKELRKDVAGTAREMLKIYNPGKKTLTL